MEFEYEYDEEHGGIVITNYTGESENVIIPDKPDGKPVVGIGEEAFSECRHIVSMKIPESVTDISVFAFDGCINIRAVYKGKIYDYEHIRELYGAINGESY